MHEQPHEEKKNLEQIPLASTESHEQEEVERYTLENENGEPIANVEACYRTPERFPKSNPYAGYREYTYDQKNLRQLTSLQFETPKGEKIDLLSIVNPYDDQALCVRGKAPNYFYMPHERSILIPEISTPEKLAMALHEFGHASQFRDPSTQALAETYAYATNSGTGFSDVEKVSKLLPSIKQIPSEWQEIFTKFSKLVSRESEQKIKTEKHKQDLLEFTNVELLGIAKESTKQQEPSLTLPGVIQLPGELSLPGTPHKPAEASQESIQSWMAALNRHSVLLEIESVEPSIANETPSFTLPGVTEPKTSPSNESSSSAAPRFVLPGMQKTYLPFAIEDPKNSAIVSRFLTSNGRFALTEGEAIIISDGTTRFRLKSASPERPSVFTHLQSEFAEAAQHLSTRHQERLDFGQKHPQIIADTLTLPRSLMERDANRRAMVWGRLLQRSGGLKFSIDAPSIQKTPNKKTSTTEAVHCGAEPPEAPHKKESRRPDFSHTLNYSLNSYGVDTKTLLKKFNGSIPFGDIPENA